MLLLLLACVQIDQPRRRCDADSGVDPCDVLTVSVAPMRPDGELELGAEVELENAGPCSEGQPGHYTCLTAAPEGDAHLTVRPVDPDLAVATILVGLPPVSCTVFEVELLLAEVR